MLLCSIKNKLFGSFLNVLLLLIIGDLKYKAITGETYRLDVANMLLQIVGDWSFDFHYDWCLMSRAESKDIDGFWY